jgi:hypothetical protein
MCQESTRSNAPLYTTEGEILIDGALMDNVPVRAMRQLKRGPFRELPSAPGIASGADACDVSEPVRFQEPPGFGRLLVPPCPRRIGLLDWQRHGELKDESIAEPERKIPPLAVSGHPALRARPDVWCVRRWCARVVEFSRSYAETCTTSQWRRASASSFIKGQPCASRA